MPSATSASPIAIVCMVSLDYLVDDTFTEKLDMLQGITVTNTTLRNSALKGWLILPMGLEKPLPVWAYFVAVLPALMLYLLLFMETHICE